MKKAGKKIAPKSVVFEPEHAGRADLLRGIAEDITSVGHKLDVDAPRLFFQKADELESERESEPESNNSDRSWIDESKVIREGAGWKKYSIAMQMSGIAILRSDCTNSQ